MGVWALMILFFGIHTDKNFLGSERMSYFKNDFFSPLESGVDITVF
jgi:hypothetical protein